MMSNFDSVICQYDGFKGYSGNPPINEDEYKSLFSEWADKPSWQQVQKQIASVAYKQYRAKEYPSLQEQLDMQYWDAVNGTTVWQDTINAIKAKYPKVG